MRMRLAAALGLAVLLGLPALSAPASAQAGAAPPAAAEEAKPKRSRTRKKTEDGAEKKEPNVGQMAARERQKKCGAEWRALGDAEKKAQGPKWPQYYSKCVKRLKEQKA